MNLRMLLGKLIRKAAWYLNLVANRLLINKRSPEYIASQRAIKWFKDDGDKTHRLNYALNDQSLVLDLGGYEGQWASDIFSMYGCSILIFEPYLPFAENIDKRFEKNTKIRVYKFGLGAKTERVEFSVMDNGSSIYGSGGQKEIVEIRSVLEFIKTNEIHAVDLMKINIEGGEYELLESLIKCGLINNIKNVQVQFHDFIIPDAARRMKRIQDALAETHRLTYQFPFVWENWTLKHNC